MFHSLWLDIRLVDESDTDASLAAQADAAMVVDPPSDDESDTDDEDLDSDEE